MALQSLPSLGATTSVPGAAGLATNVPAPGSSGGASDGVLRITVPLGEAPETFSSVYKRLFGVDPANVFKAKSETDGSGNTAGSEVLDSPAPVSGNLDDLIAWAKENAALLIVAAIVLLLALYGVSAATRR